MTQSPTRGEPAAEAKPSRSADPSTGAAKAFAAFAGLSFGASAFLSFGFYEITVWGPLGLAWLAIALGLGAARPAQPTGPALAAVLGPALLWVWSLLSTRWAEATGPALVEADRWLLYAVVLVALLLLVRGRGLERTLVGGAVAGVLATGGWLMVRMLAGDGPELFLTNRLNDPAEYVNATAAYLLIGVWPLIALAESARSLAVRALGVAGGTWLVGLALMTQSRGGFAAFAISALIVLAAIPGRARRGWALALVAAAVAATWPWVGDVAQELPAGSGAPGADVIRSGALAVLAAGAVAGAAWLAAEAAVRRVPDASRASARLVAGAALAGLVLAGGLVATFPWGERVQDVRDQYDDFKELAAVDPGGSRFASGGGNRYDYWSVAMDQFRDDPLGGVGAGNYDTTYFRDRKSAEDVRQPHSIELQALGETGIVGGILLAVMVGGIIFAGFRRAHGDGPELDRPLAVAAGGMFALWLVHTSVDWLHLIPGLTGIALCAAAALLAPWMRAVELPSRRGAVAGLAAAGAVAACAAVSLAIPSQAEHLRDQARDRLASDPEGALEDARSAVDLDPGTIEGRYLEAAAQARLGDGAGATATLEEAARREPSDYVTWVLLGDLALRRGDVAAARNAYIEASGLNPRDPALAQLASSRQAVEQFAEQQGIEL